MEREIHHIRYDNNNNDRGFVHMMHGGKGGGGESQYFHNIHVILSSLL